MFIQALLNPETDQVINTHAASRSDDILDQQQNAQITKSSYNSLLNSLPDGFIPASTINEPHANTTNNNSRSQRSKKMQMEDKTENCPICNIQISSATITEHIEQELSKLQDNPPPENVNVRTRRGAALHARKKVQSQIHLLKEARSEDDHEEIEISNNREILHSVKKRRQTRQNNSEPSTPKKRSAPTSQQVKQECFMCGEKLVGDLEDINAHIDRCLSGNNSTAAPTSSNSSSSGNKKSSRSKKSKKNSNFVEQEEEQVETYVWGEETRVRSCSVAGEGYADLVNADRMKKGDESAELDVMEDDAETQYGAPQYSEADLIHVEDNEDESERTLRKRVSDNFQNHATTNNNNGTVSTKQYSNVQRVEEVNLTIQTSDSPHTSSPLIEALKAKIIELQKLATNSYKCLVCLEQYQVPLVSVQCWHVYCEKCWLAALGSKKLCPQCKTITTPNDLRKIFL